MKDNEKSNIKEELKEGDEEKEDLNNRNSIDEYIKKRLKWQKRDVRLVIGVLVRNALEEHLLKKVSEKPNSNGGRGFQRK